jgi:hypothetical protein
MVFEDDDDDDPKHVTVRNSIVRVDRASAPAELLIIPANARLVPSRRAGIEESIKDLDRGTNLPNRP